MDLEGFVANRELLERLSREYELLKASGGECKRANSRVTITLTPRILAHPRRS